MLHQTAEIQLERRCGREKLDRFREFSGKVRERSGAEDETDHGDDRHTDNHGTLRPAGNQSADDDHADHGEENLRIPEVAKRHEGRLIPHNETAVLHADERDEEANTGRNRGLHGHRNRIDNQLPDAGEGEEREDDAGDEHRGEACLPGEPHRSADDEREEGADAETRGDSDREISPEAHDERRDHGDPYR